jgi:hypothetical protein
MSYLFPVDRVRSTKSDTEMISAVEKIKDQEKEFNSNKDRDEERFDQLEEKVKNLISDKKFLEAIELVQLDNQAKAKLIEIIKNAADSFLKKELLTVAKSILCFSTNEKVNDEIDEEDLTFSDHLAKLIMKLAIIKRSASQEGVAKKLGKSNPLEDKNAGFLVHFCKDRLNQELKQKKNEFKLEKLNKKDLLKFLKK